MKKLAFFLLFLSLLSASLKQQVWDAVCEGDRVFIGTTYGLAVAEFDGKSLKHIATFKLEGQVQSLLLCDSYVVVLNGPSGIFFFSSRPPFKLEKHFKVTGLEGVCWKGALFVAAGSEGVLRIQPGSWQLRRRSSSGYAMSLAVAGEELLVGEGFIFSGIEAFSFQLRRLWKREFKGSILRSLSFCNGKLLAADERKGLLLLDYPDLKVSARPIKLGPYNGASFASCWKEYAAGCFYEKGCRLISLENWPQIKVRLGRFAGYRVRSCGQKLLICAGQEGLYLWDRKGVKRVDASLHR